MKNKMVIAIDIGGTTIKGGLVDQQGKIIYKQKIASQASQGACYVLDNIHSICDDINLIARKENFKINSIGVSTAGTVAPSEGKIVFATETFKNWQGTKLKDKMESKFRQSVYVENDAHAAGWGEKCFGVAREYNDFIILTLGTGIGGAIFSKGKLYSGATNFAGLFGQMCVNPSGEISKLGVRGPLENYTAARGFDEITKKIYEYSSRDIQNSSLLSRKVQENKTINPKEVFAASEKSDKLAEKILTKVLCYLGVGIGNLITILDPELVILAGGISKAGNQLITPLKKQVEKFCPDPHYQNITIKLSPNLDNSGLLGAAAVGFNGGIPRLN